MYPLALKNNSKYCRLDFYLSILASGQKIRKISINYCTSAWIE